MKKVRIAGRSKVRPRNPVARQLRTGPFLPRQVPDKRARSRTIRGPKHRRDDLS